MIVKGKTKGSGEESQKSMEVTNAKGLKMVNSLKIAVDEETAE